MSGVYYTCSSEKENKTEKTQPVQDSTCSARAAQQQQKQQHAGRPKERYHRAFGAVNFRNNLFRDCRGCRSN